MSACLDMLSAPDHHPDQREWAYRILAAMSPKERLQFDRAREICDGFLNLDTYFDPRLIDIADDGFTQDYPAFIREQQDAMSQNPDFPSASVAITPEDLAELTVFLDYFYQAHFKPIMDSRADAIRDRIRQGRELVDTTSAAELAVGLSDRITYDQKNDILSFEKWLELKLDAAVMECFEISISLFAFPHMLVGYESDRYFSIAWDMPFAADSRRISSIDSLAKIAFALSDKSRLRILLLLSRQQMSQKEIGENMGYAKSTISRHISILEEAGIITRHGDSPRGQHLLLNQNLLSRYSSELMKWIE